MLGTSVAPSPRGPLHGVRIVEFSGLGPGPFGSMLLADLGADIVRVVRRGPPTPTATPIAFDVVQRSRETIALDLKDAADRDRVLRLIAGAHGLVEGFRPGVMERLGLGPEICLARRPELVYCRVTGWGQDGPLAHTAGHDINYIARTGMLNAIGRAGQPPTPPLNLGGDYGGGGAYLAIGLLAALIEARASGLGQVVDVAMIDGAASLMAKFYGQWCAGVSSGNPVGPRGTNLLDTGAPFYDVYECSDGNWVAVGAVEDAFYEQLVAGLGLKLSDLPPQWDKPSWPMLRAQFSAQFKTKPREHWNDVFAHIDACVSPVLSIGEASGDAHLRARDTLLEVDGVVQPAPAPRFSRTPLAAPTASRHLVSDCDAVLARWEAQ